MAALTLSYAQALRVIGQDLIPLGINSFELAKWGDDYIVWMEHDEFARDQSAKKTFFAKITQKMLGDTDSDKETPNRMYFNSSDIFSENIERGSKRSTSDSPKDLRDLSFFARDRRLLGSKTSPRIYYFVVYGLDKDSLWSERRNFHNTECIRFWNKYVPEKIPSS